MEATMVGLTGYLGGYGEAAGEHAEAELRALARRLEALILPRVARFADERRALTQAAYAQYRHERGIDPAQNRLKSFKLGEFSATLESTGLTREQALFPGGLCAEAKALITDCGLFYRGVGAC